MLQRFNPLLWIAGFFVWALCAGAAVLLTALVLYAFRPNADRWEDDWDGLDDECEHMRDDAPGSCARCEGT